MPLSQAHLARLKARLRQLKSEWNEIGTAGRPSIPSGWKRTLWDKQGGRCIYCHRELSDLFHVDHVIPRASGGPDHLTNYVLACPLCNHRKSAMSPLEWLERIQWSPLP